MSGSSATLLWAFIAGVLAVAAILAALGAALVIYQRRFMAMHRAYSRNLLKAQEEERAWVAREVHDNVVHHLGLIGRELAGLRQLEPAVTETHAHRLSGIEEEVRELATVLRGLAHRLHPALLERGELTIALLRLQSDVERAYGLRVATVLPDTPTPTDPARALAVYRVAQEALHNVAVHAGVSDATLTLTRSNGALRLTVSDRGSGFDLRQRRPGGGLGLIGMRERAEIAGGKLTVTSRPGAGTTVELSFS